ncbi:AraC family transcriptional regulator [Paenibacillus koleovorans]|uniref:AraC family transcriptional regulator n=1 Tax=Paenibacillus koleovorans TaxID=121608 RepID=UPI000FD9E485|nr:AraC family transcriptional regulator [Paenibacillus koleovorans]
MIKLHYYQELIPETQEDSTKFPFWIWTYSQDSSYLHHHDFAELSFVIEGNGSETVNGYSHSLSPGTVTFIPPHQLHKYQCISGSLIRKYCLIFDVGLLSKTSLHACLLNRLLLFGNSLPSWVTLSADQRVRMMSMMNEIWREYNHAEIGRTSVILTKLIEMLILLLRAHNDYYGINMTPSLRPRLSLAIDETDTGRMHSDKPNPTLEHMYDVVQYIHSNFNKSIKLEDMSTRYGISNSYFCNLFKKLTGVNFLDYLHALRIRSAVSLLKHTEHSVTDISLESGFDSVRTFTRVFKNIMGVTPTQYRSASTENVSW